MIGRLSSPAHFDREDTAARATFLALCGWSLRLLRGPSSSEGAYQAIHVNPEDAALQCTMCGTRLGLWYFFGDGRMPVPGTGDVAGPRTTFPTLSSGASIAVNNQVAVNTNMTIAGGPFRATSDAGASTGPFGSPQAGAAAFSMRLGSRDASEGLAKSPASSVPPESTTRLQQQGSQESRRLASYKASWRSHVDPLDAHKAFCPWANVIKASAASTDVADVAEVAEGKRGWQVYLQCLDSHR